MSIEIILNRTTKKVEISRNGKTFSTGLVFNMPHFRAVEKRFKAWDKQGWPYEPKDT